MPHLPWDVQSHIVEALYACLGCTLLSMVSDMYLGQLRNLVDCLSTPWKFLQVCSLLHFKHLGGAACPLLLKPGLAPAPPELVFPLGHAFTR